MIWSEYRDTLGEFSKSWYNNAPITIKVPCGADNENEDGEELDENGDGDQPQERCFEVQGGPADDVEGHKVSW